MGRRAALFVGGLILLLPLPTRAQTTTARDTLPFVRRVEIGGNAAFSDDEIRNAIATRASGCKSFVLAPLCWAGLDIFKRRERLDPRELRTDVARVRIYYYRRGYRQAQVDTTLVREKDQVDISFAITEGDSLTVRELVIRGLEGVPDWEEIVEDLPLMEGRRFSEIRLDESQIQIKRELGNRGYAQAAVLVSSRIPKDSLGVRVLLEAVPGPLITIGDVEVSGTVEVDPADVKRLLSFKTGDVYNAEEILSSQRRLYRQALFEYVDMQTTPVSDSTMDVRVQVNEAKMRGINFGFGLSNTECIQVQAAWTHRNFLKGARTLQLSGALSNIGTAQLANGFPCDLAGVDPAELGATVFNKVNWRLRADFLQPWILGTENQLRLGIFSERVSLPNVYAVTSVGGDITFSREIASVTGIRLAYRPQYQQFEEGSAGFFFCANFGICQPADISKLANTNLLSPISFTISSSKTDAVFSPTRGYRLTVEGEHASRFTLSDWAYYRVLGEFAWYQRLNAGTVLALRVRGGAVRPIGSGIENVDLEAGSAGVTNPLKRFYAGGASTVRGYGQNLLGPKVFLAEDSTFIPPNGPCDPTQIIGSTWLCDPNQSNATSDSITPRPSGGENLAVANLELRVPLGSQRWTGVAFVDFGRVWTGRAVTTSDAWAWSPGLGFRYLSPVGPLRVDIAYNTGGTVQNPVVSQISETREVVSLGRPDGSPIPLGIDPFDKTGLAGFFQRLQLHFSIGQAF